VQFSRSCVTLQDMAAAAGTAELVGGGHPGALGADAPSACKVARSAHADDVTCCRRDDCSRPREPDSARLLDELLEHLPATAQAVSWVQDLSASEPGRRCISAVSRAFTCVLPFLQEASSSTDRARSTSSSLDSKSAPDGEQHSALKFQTGLESARIVCADSWRALHAPGQHWRTVDGRWREAYSLGCMLRAIHLLWQHCSDTDGPAGHGARVHIHPGMPSQLRIVQGHCGDEESLRGDELERLDAAGSPTSGGEGGDGQWWTVEDPRGLDEPGKHTAQNIGGAVSKDIEALRWLDLALLFGGSRARVHVHRMIARLSRAIAECPPTSAYTHPTPSPAARRAGATGEGASCQAGGEGGGRALVAARGRLRTAIERCQAPSLIGFKTRFLDPAHAVVLTGAVDHWPALRKWSSWEYVKAVAGERSVPVEVGKHYLSSAWHQRLMSVGQLIDSFTLDPKPQPIGSSASGHGGAGGGAGGMLYMAQHDLFEQVPDLRRDILVPDYTALPVRDARVPDEFVTNAWLGPGGTVSPLHFDDYENILVQVRGGGGGSERGS
jgi:hypothetical protein